MSAIHGAYCANCCLLQTAKKLLDLFTKLRELGHPEFLQKDVEYSLHCTFTQEEADEMVSYASVWR